MSEPTQEEVDRHNARELWSDVANHLTIAHESIETAQGALEDLERGDFADLLQPLHDALRRAANDARERTHD
jgi:hypothetical protein